MRLRCDGIFNDYFIMQSLLSLRVKKFWKLVNICRSYGQLSTGSFLWNTVYIYKAMLGTNMGWYVYHYFILELAGHVNSEN